jgi:uncharacterized protein YjbI with pentapeptide repeats
MCILKKALAVGARFDGADLTYADFSHADVSAGDFSGATMFRTRLHRIKDEGTVWTLSKGAALGDNEELLEAETWQARVLGRDRDRPNNAG